MTDTVAEKYEAIRRGLVPRRNKMKDQFNKTRLTTLIENCTEIAKSGHYDDIFARSDAGARRS